MEAQVSLRARRGLLAWLCILAKPLVGRLIYVLANLCDVFVFTCGLYVDDETLPIGRADKPPTRQSRVASREHQDDRNEGKERHSAASRSSRRALSFSGKGSCGHCNLEVALHL